MAEKVDKIKEMVYNKSYLVDRNPVLLEAGGNMSAINGIIRETEVCKHYVENISA